MEEQVLILGAGLAGLNCARHLAAAGRPVTVLEREDGVGGLARSFSEDGFTYDLGPHRLLVDRQQADGFGRLLGQQLARLERRSRIYLKGRFFDYPLRVGNAMFSMPPLTTVRILADYVRAQLRQRLHPSPDENFEQWVESRFGRTLYELFFKQYTEKAWGIPCTAISADWASQRISLLSLWDAFWQAVKPKRGARPRTYASSFFYPPRGGIGRLADALAGAVGEAGGQVLPASPVEAIELDGRRVRAVRAGGRRHLAGQVVSTMPLPDFVRLAGRSAPGPVRQAATGLHFRAIVFVYLFLDRPRLSEDHWIYLPEERFVANRLTESVNFSRENAPRGSTVVCAEITCAAGDDVWNTSDDVLAERVVADLERLELFSASRRELLRVGTRRAAEAYPVYDLGYAERVERVLGWLNSLENLQTIGRGALFRYNNMDHSLEMGRRAAAVVVGDRPRAWATEVATGSQYFG